MADKSRRSKGSNRLLGPAGDYVALGIIVFASIALTVVAISGFTLRPGATVVPTSNPVPTFDLDETTTSTPAPTPSSPVVVSLLGDSITATADSWWALSVGSGRVQDALPGATITGTATTSGEAVDADALRQALEANTTLSGVVIAQAGSAEVADTETAAAVVLSVQELWQGIVDRGARPIAALLAPSDSNPQRVIELNSAISAAAAEAGVPVLDLHTPVASPEGGWAPGLSDDGATPNLVGTEAMAQATITQLPTLLAAASPVTPPAV